MQPKKRSNQLNSKNQKYKPATGPSDFDGTSEPVLKALESYETSSFRDKFAYTLFCSSMAALAVSGAYSFYKDDFSYIVAVWAVIAPICGAVVNHYFRGRKDSG
ncbi:MAG: hypothetical protein EOP04_11500 [Proteobacteria bacterium]|nr:MAG: hypothetical protein EOP04_11500 [Pseudomonadota bacterium]